MVEFARLSGALDGNEALRRRARLASLSLTVLSGDEAISVGAHARIVAVHGLEVVVRPEVTSATSMASGRN